MLVQAGILCCKKMFGTMSAQVSLVFKSLHVGSQNVAIFLFELLFPVACDLSFSTKDKGIDV